MLGFRLANFTVKISTPFRLHQNSFLFLLIEHANLISKYLKKNYPQHMINELYFKTDKEIGNCYLLIMKKTGDKKITKLFFDLYGNVLKTETENL